MHTILNLNYILLGIFIIFSILFIPSINAQTNEALTGNQTLPQQNQTSIGSGSDNDNSGMTDLGILDNPRIGSSSEECSSVMPKKGDRADK